MYNLVTQTEAILLLVAIVAGIVDALAGGGGLITVPALLIAGLSPLSAVATNKLQGVFGTGVATLTFVRGNYLNLKTEVPVSALCFFELLAERY